MAEAVLFNVLASCLEKLSFLAQQEIPFSWCVNLQLRTKLRDSIAGISKALEEGQLANTSPANHWLEKVRDLAYDAEDVLDDLTTEVLRQRKEDDIGCCNPEEVCNFFSRFVYYQMMDHQIKDIRDRLREIKIDPYNFYPIAASSFRPPVVDTETDSFLANPSAIIGREKDKEEIVELLMELEDENAINVPVIPIVGMGGVGKTTLAKLVFNDEMISRHFDLKIWVCVSDDFDVKTIAKNVLEYITSKKFDYLAMELMLHALRNELYGKRYLLVLDDVWNEDHHRWMALKNLLMGGRKGSKILITTRSDQVALVMSTTSRRLSLGPLSKEACWSVFKHRAFREGEEERYINLVQIGKKIVKKCQGLPLAIASLGSLLYCNTDQQYWKFIRDNEIWKLTENNHILPALKLSYDHLSSPLKACFAYCSLFPKDYEIERETLIHLWTANSLIQSSTRQMEDVGNEYFNILFSRSFFQDAEKDNNGNIISCKMHDLMHDLARSVAGTEYLIDGEGTAAPGVEKLQPRHVFLSSEFNPQMLSASPKLRTILNCRINLDVSLDKCLLFKCLRALDLSSSNVVKLSDSIGELKHLRYLDLSNTRITTFPDSVCKLLNLQTLKVRYCYNLKELPNDIREMVNLRHIDNLGTSFTHMPYGLGNLSSLQTLRKFFVGDGIGCRIRELGTLDGLGGELSLKNIAHVRDATEAEQASLEKKGNLNFLSLEWGSEDDWVGRRQHHEHVLESLHPPPNLRALYIKGYAGVDFPSWGIRALQRLVKIELVEFIECQHLSALRELPSLRILHLQGMRQLESVGGGFTSLEELRLIGLPSLKKWDRSRATDHDGTVTTQEGQLLCLPHLALLDISYCPSLVAMPFQPSLEQWTLRSGRIEELLLQSMASNPTSAPHSCLPTLKSLNISLCDDLEYFPAERLQSLEFLCIDECDRLASLPISQYLTHLEIKNCPVATWWEKEKEDSFPGFRSLKSLSIDNLPKVVSLPSPLQHAASLQSLKIYNCQGLTTIPEWLTNLTSVQELDLRNCPLLTTLPTEMQRLSRLRDLTIWACPHLYKQFKRKTGEDWNKIAHVPHKSFRE